MKYRELLQEGAEQLKKAAIVDADVDAAYLLEYVCGIDRTHYLLCMTETVPPQMAARYEEAIALRATHQPLQYITGEQEFMGLSFQVSPEVLIPRQDTETLVEQTQRVLKDDDRILDMCTGSGCILISLLHENKTCQGMGVDIADTSIALARENAKKNDVQAEWLVSDLFSDVYGAFDVIVSNPPYIATAVLQELMPEVIEHEPQRALDGHEDGLYFYRQIIADAPSYLKPGGWILFEIGYDQGESVPALLTEAGFTEITVIKDYNGNDRVVRARLHDL